MPAHGRGLALPREISNLLKKRPGIWDLPELPDFGGPLEESGAVAESQEFFAAQFGVKRCWYGVNGATGLLQAALIAMVRPGKAVLMPRNVHRSLIHACAIAHIKPVFFDLPFLADRGHVQPPDVKWMKKVLEQISIRGLDLSAVVLVNPTYHGYSSSLEPLVRMLHLSGLPVLVDEAHGFHFAISDELDLPASAISVGADLVVHSLHKSGPGLVQSAVLWLQGDRIDPFVVNRSVGWVQTSSPSALLLASCEASLREFLRPLGQRRLRQRVDAARKIAFDLLSDGLPLLPNQDPLRLILHTSTAGVSGFEADRYFISKELVAELPEPGCLTFCLGLVRHRGLVKLLQKRWNALLSTRATRKPLGPFLSPEFPLISVLSMDCGTAWTAEFVKLPLQDSVGSVCAELICPYPPGIPMVIPGELLDSRRVQWLISQRTFWANQIPSEIGVLK